MNWIAIISPNAIFKRKINKEWLISQISPITKEIFFTEYQGHAGEIVQHENGYDGIIAVSGDGTLHNIISNLDYTRKSIAIVAAGTGNSLGRDLGQSFLSHNTKIMIGKQHKIDLMKVNFIKSNGEHCSYISASTISVGYPALVTDNANKRFKNLGSQLCYPVASLFNAFTCKKKPITISYDSTPPQKNILKGIMLTNTHHTANFVCLPNTTCNDGKAEAIYFNYSAFKQILHNISVLTKKYFLDPYFNTTFNHFKFELEQPDLLMIDGEIYEDVMSLEVKLLPSCLNCYVCTD